MSALFLNLSTFLPYFSCFLNGLYIFVFYLKFKDWIGDKILHGGIDTFCHLIVCVVCSQEF